MYTDACNCADAKLSVYAMSPYILYYKQLGCWYWELCFRGKLSSSFIKPDYFVSSSFTFICSETDGQNHLYWFGLAWGRTKRDATQPLFIYRLLLLFPSVVHDLIPFLFFFFTRNWRCPTETHKWSYPVNKAIFANWVSFCSFHANHDNTCLWSKYGRPFEIQRNI